MLIKYLMINKNTYYHITKILAVKIKAMNICIIK